MSAIDTRNGPVLTGAGMREYRHRLWLMACLGILALAAVVILAMQKWRSPAQAALDEFAAAVAPTDEKVTRLPQTIRRRAWLASCPSQPEGVAIFRAFPDAKLGRERAVTASQIASNLLPLKGLGYSASLGGWAAHADLVRLQEALSRLPADAVATAVAADLKLTFIDQEGLRRRLEAACDHPDDARLVFDILVGQPHADVPDLAARLIANAATPAPVHVIPFTGREGVLWVPVGPASFRLTDAAYRGLLVRFDMPGVPAGWRVAWLEVSGP